MKGPTRNDQTITHYLRIPGGVDPVTFLGPADQVVRTIERAFPEVEIRVEDRQLRVRGPEAGADLVRMLLEELGEAAAEGTELTPELVEQAVELLPKGTASTAAPALLVGRGKVIKAKTAGQQDYLSALEKYPIVFGIGPAGTGKTYLAMAAAVAALLEGKVKRLILTRPAVEAGENLGFLPGTATEKIDPYLRPLFDALNELLGEGSLAQLITSGAIEIAPLAYMRGRTLNDAYIILDEAQNTTATQMKMFLTRLGFNSKMVVTGDDSQIDLVQGRPSGLVLIQHILEDVPQVKFCYLTSADVVRNSLVADIIDAYARWEEEEFLRGTGERGRRGER